MAVSRFSGTIWQGRMQIGDGHVLSWTLRPGASLLAFGFAADWQVAGPGTDLAGRAVLWADGADVGPMSGVASWPLVAAALPNLPIFCNGQARFAAVKLRLTNMERLGSGVITVPPAECVRADGSMPPTPVPALHAQISTQPGAVNVLVTPQDGPRVALLTAQVTAADRLVITIHREGAALVPGMPSTSDSELDLPLSVLLDM